MLTRVTLAVTDPSLEQYLAKSMQRAEMQTECYRDSATLWQQVVQSCADLIVISDRLIQQPVEAGISMLSQLPEAPITVILQEVNIAEQQAKYIAAGAHTVLYHHLPLENLCNAIEATAESRRQAMVHERFDRRGKAKPKLADFSSQSEPMQLFMNEVEQVAGSDSLLLLTGETGVGKEHLAKVIHGESPRAAGPFIAVNTVALPEQLLESELFGHRQGAFTGATRARRGAFEQAHGGTIFLDEIGEMPLHLQAKLLRVLQEYEVHPLGAEKPFWVDVRVIAATNRDLEYEVQRGNFRKDLYYRLSVVRLHIPPLRERREDIPSLARRFMLDFRHKIGREVRQISEPALAALCRYDWPGNIRELMNVIERLMLLCKTSEIRVEDLPTALYEPGEQEFGQQGLDHRLPAGWRNKSLAEVLQEVQGKVERRYLQQVLSQTGGRLVDAAALSGITTRSLYTKMQRYGLRKEQFKAARRSKTTR